MFAGQEGPLLEAVTRKRLLTLRAIYDFVRSSDLQSVAISVRAVITRSSEWYF
jgi:hypothetical protein